MTLGPKWPELDLGKATQMAVIHDKMEIFTGDMVAVGLSGNGSDSHAFNDKLKAKKRRDEDRAFERYLAKLHSRSRSHIREIYEEYHAKKSPEARFVDALDKLEPFVRILYAKKDKYAGNRQAEWLEFCERYHKPRVAQFPDLLPYAEEMLRRIKSRRS